jgi:hypothetical protein
VRRSSQPDRPGNAAWTNDSPASALGCLKGTWTDTPEDLNEQDEDMIGTDCESPLKRQQSDPSSLMFRDSDDDLDDGRTVIIY